MDFRHFLHAGVGICNLNGKLFEIWISSQWFLFSRVEIGRCLWIFLKFHVVSQKKKFVLSGSKWNRIYLDLQNILKKTNALNTLKQIGLKCSIWKISSENDRRAKSACVWTYPPLHVPGGFGNNPVMKSFSFPIKLAKRPPRSRQSSRASSWVAALFDTQKMFPSYTFNRLRSDK